MISILIPTRKRPNLLNSCLNSALENSAKKFPVEFLIYIDKDDPETLNYVENKSNLPIKYMFGDRVPLSKTYNLLFKEFNPCDIIMYAADDLNFATKDWNVVIEDVFQNYKDKIVLVFGPDGIHNNFPTHGFVHANWVNCLGQVFPDWLWGEMADSFMDEIAILIGRKIRAEIFIEHIHYSAGKRQDDEVDHEKFRRQAENNCVRKFHDTKHERVAYADQLINFIRDFKNSNNKVA